MSFNFNYKFWVATKREINNLIKRQNVLKNREPIDDPLITFQIMSQLYVLYSEMVNKLAYLYKITLQVQKRDLIQNLVEAFVQQLMNLKNELKQIELSECVYLDKTIISRKLTPQNLIIWRSPNFLYRRPPEIENVFLEEILFNTDIQEKKIRDKQEEINQAVIKIQAHERARQARVYKSLIKYDNKMLKRNIGQSVKYAFSDKSEKVLSIPVKRTVFNKNFVKANEICSYLTQKGSQKKEVLDDDSEKLLNERIKSALIIQRAWRRYKANKVCRIKRNFRQALYGMKKKRKLISPDAYNKSISEIYKNECLKKKLDEDYQQFMTDERTRILQERGPQIMEDISDHIREWFKEFYQKCGDFHPYPDALKSGTILVITDESMDFTEFKEYKNKQGMSKQDKKNLEEKLKLQKLKQKQKLKKEKLKEAKKRKKQKEAGIYDIGYELRSSENIKSLENIMKQFSNDWKRVDEYLNKQNEVFKEWVTESELSQIHKELRMHVDEYMRIEYELLKKAWSEDNKQPYKPSKSKQPKKGKKKRRKRHIHDPTSDRTIESLFEELKTAGIIEYISKKTLDDFIGEFNLIADQTRNPNQMITSDPTTADLKMVIQDNMFGMGAFNVEKPKSICLIGPSNIGKKLLCHIIAAELDALFMNLSPEKTFSFSNNRKYFIHVVMKVAKAFQPTIIFIQDAHRIFWKKVPKDQIHLKTSLLKDDLLKHILKPIKKHDKIMVLGTSNSPWSATPKFKQVFQNILLVPRPDYGTVFLLWLELLTQNLDQNSLNDSTLSALAKVFRAYNAGDITNCVTNTVNVERRMHICKRPLQPREFLEYLIGQPDPIFPPDNKTYETYLNWFNKTNKFAKMKISAIKAEEQRQKKK